MVLKIKLSYILFFLTFDLTSSELHSSNLRHKRDTSDWLRYPLKGNYVSNDDRTWNLNDTSLLQPQGMMSSITIEYYVDIEDSQGCVYDRLTFSNPNTNHIDSFCGRNVQGKYTNEVPADTGLVVRFQSDSVVQYSGFSISYHIHSYYPEVQAPVGRSLTDPNSCDVVRRGDAGDFTSPGYPAIYPGNQNCNYTALLATTLTGTTVHIRMEYELEPQYHCLFDYIELTFPDGSSQKYCGSDVTELDLKVKYGQFSARFVSDNAIQAGKGFRLTYQVKQNVPIFSRSVGLPSDGPDEGTGPEDAMLPSLNDALPAQTTLMPPSPSAQECLLDQWEAVGRWEYGFNPELLPFDASQAACSLCGGHLASVKTQQEHDVTMQALQRFNVSEKPVWLGASDREQEGQWRWMDGSSLTFTSWKNGEPNNTDVTSEADCLLMNSKGKWKDQDCGRPRRSLCRRNRGANEPHSHGSSKASKSSSSTVRYSGNSGYIQSPRYPLTYPTNVDRDFIVTLDQSGPLTVLLRLDDFDLEEEVDCDFDYLAINNGQRICGFQRGTKRLVEVEGSSFSLTFHSDATSVGRGFNISYSILPDPETDTPSEPEPESEDMDQQLFTPVNADLLQRLVLELRKLGGATGDAASRWTRLSQGIREAGQLIRMPEGQQSLDPANLGELNKGRK